MYRKTGYWMCSICLIFLFFIEAAVAQESVSTEPKIYLAAPNKGIDLKENRPSNNMIEKGAQFLTRTSIDDTKATNTHFKLHIPESYSYEKQHNPVLQQEHLKLEELKNNFCIVTLSPMPNPKKFYGIGLGEREMINQYHHALNVWEQVSKKAVARSSNIQLPPMPNADQFYGIGLGERDMINQYHHALDVWARILD